MGIFSLGFSGARDWGSSWHSPDIWISPSESFTTCGLGLSTCLHAMCLIQWGELSGAPFVDGKPFKVPCLGLLLAPTLGMQLCSPGIGIMTLQVWAVLTPHGPLGSFSLLFLSDTWDSLFLYFLLLIRDMYWKLFMLYFIQHSCVCGVLRGLWCRLSSHIGWEPLNSHCTLIGLIGWLHTLGWRPEAGEPLKQQSLGLLRSQHR